MPFARKGGRQGDTCIALFQAEADMGLPFVLILLRQDRVQCRRGEFLGRREPLSPASATAPALSLSLLLQQLSLSLSPLLALCSRAWQESTATFSYLSCLSLTKKMAFLAYSLKGKWRRRQMGWWRECLLPVSSLSSQEEARLETSPPLVYVSFTSLSTLSLSNTWKNNFA